MLLAPLRLMTCAHNTKRVEFRNRLPCCNFVDILLTDRHNGSGAPRQDLK